MGASGLHPWPPLFSPLTTLMIPSSLRTFSFTYVLMTCKFLFPSHASPLNARVVFLSPPGCLISIFKHKMSKMELLFSPQTLLPPLPHLSSWQIHPYNFLESKNGGIHLLISRSTCNPAADPSLLSSRHV